MADAAPVFALYVSSVEGRVASRPGSPHSYIGCRLRSPEEVKAGQTEPTWQPEVIVPVLESEYRAYLREWNALVRDGDVLEHTEAEFLAYQAALEKREAARDAELAREAKKAEAEAKRKAAPEKVEAPSGAGGGSQ